jgi:hypothetical protein
MIAVQVSPEMGLDVGVFVCMAFPLFNDIGSVNPKTLA